GTAVSRDRSQRALTESCPTGVRISAARNPNASFPARTVRANCRKRLLSLTGFCVCIWVSTPQYKRRLLLKRLGDAAHDCRHCANLHRITSQCLPDEPLK